MPFREQKKFGEPLSAGTKQSGILKDEGLAVKVSAYLDGQLEGKDLEEFKALLRENASLAREVHEMRIIELRLMEMGADILSEPVPEALLGALSKAVD